MDGTDTTQCMSEPAKTSESCSPTGIDGPGSRGPGDSDSAVHPEDDMDGDIKALSNERDDSISLDYQNSIKKGMLTTQAPSTANLEIEDNSNLDQGIFLMDPDSAQESDTYDSYSPESTQGISVQTFNEDSLNTVGSYGSYSRGTEVNKSGSIFSHSRQSSSGRSEKRVRIEATPLCIEVDTEQDRKKTDVGFDDYGTEKGFEDKIPPASEYSINAEGRKQNDVQWTPPLKWTQIINRRRRSRANSLFKWIPSDGHLKLELGRGDLIRKYQLHVFVFLIFLVTVLSVSLSWHYRNLATQMLHASQAIFFNPRTRLLTLTGSGDSRSINGHVGLDMPNWQLPLHCPIVMGNNPHDKECVWKNNAILRIKQFSEREKTGHDSPVECYKVSWESLHPQHVPHDCFDINDDLWYGPSNQSESLYPIKGEFFFSPSNYTVGNNGVFSSVADFYWLSAKGVGLRVNADDPVQVFWNQTGSDRLCILSNYTGPFYHQINHETAPHLNYTLCTGPDALSTHNFMLSLLEPQEKQQAPSLLSNLSGAHWSIRDHLGQTEVNQTHVIQMAERLQESGFEGTKITLDSEWQAVHGDLKFDPERFPNVTQMFEDLSALNCQLTLCVSPYFRFSSKNFEKGVTEGKFVHDAGGRVTGLADTEFGLAATADVTVPHTRAWLTERLRAIHRNTSADRESASGGDPLVDALDDDVKVHNFRLTYGSREWLPYKPHFRLGEDATPNMYRRRMTETFSTVSDSLVVEHTSDSRHVPGLIPVQAKLTRSGDRRCLTTDVIETAFTLGLLGYPYIMVDGVTAANGNDLQPDDLTQELYIRWLELATLFPAHQHPATPWQFKDANLTVAMAANLSRQNEALKMAVLKDKTLIKEVSSGLPVVRPFWWNDIKNQTAHSMEIKDEFLMGGKLLVAPVLCEGVTSRDIHLPRGVWQDYHAPTRYVIGPVTIRDYSTPLGQTAVFKKVADTANMAGGNKDSGSL